MKKVILLFFFTWFFLCRSFSQDGSLLLRLSFESILKDSTSPLNIRIDFISSMADTVSFLDRPLYLLECNLDDVGLESEVLKENCYTAIPKSECHPLNGLSQIKDNLKKLHYGDTATFRSYIFLLDKDQIYKKRKGFTGSYRFRVYRFYSVKGQRKQIHSNWLYVDYPKS